MCRFFLALPAALVACVLATAAVGEDGPYVRVDAGFSFVEMTDFGSEFDLSSRSWDESFETPVVGLGFGYRFDRFRGDVTLDRRSEPLDKFLDPRPDLYPRAAADLITYSVMLNGYWDMADFDLDLGFVDAMLTPYVGAGFGHAIHRGKIEAIDVVRDYSYTDEDSTFAFALHAGVALQVTDRMAIDVSYRYQDMGKFQMVDIGYTDLRSHDIRGGLRYSF